MIDKREIRRHKKRITIRFGIDEPNRIAFTEDVSRTGMFIKTPNVSPPNTKIKIVFELVSDQKIEVEARVMWAKKVPPNVIHLVKKCGMGVRFLRFEAGEELFHRYFEQSSTQS